MCNCHSILECCVMFAGVKLSVRPFNLYPSVCDVNLLFIQLLVLLVSMFSLSSI